MVIASLLQAGREQRHPAIRRRLALQGFTLVELLVVIAIIGVLVGLLLPAVQSAREAARRSACSNNVKQIGLALHNAHDTKGAFPALEDHSDAFLQGQNNNWGETPGNWLIHILPYIEETSVYDQIDFSIPWNAGNNKQAFMNKYSVFICPSNPIGNKTTGNNFDAHIAHYFGVWGSKDAPGGRARMQWAIGNNTNADGKGIFYFNSKTTFGQITDGTSKTMAVGEVRGYRPESPFQKATVAGDGGRGMRWEVGTSPMLLPINGIDGPGGSNCPNCRWENMASFHPGGIHVGLADGSTKYINEQIDTTTFLRLGSMMDGQVLGEY